MVWVIRIHTSGRDFPGILVTGFEKTVSGQDYLDTAVDFLVLLILALIILLFMILFYSFSSGHTF